MVLHYGTFNGHRLTMKVVAANLDLLSARRRISETCIAVGDAAIAGLREVFPPAKDKGHRAGLRTHVSDLLHRP